MSWRQVVITGCAKLDYKMDYLVVRKQEETRKVYIGEIALLLIESTAVSLTTTLISELIKKKVKVIFCDEKHNPQSELLSFYGCHDSSLKIKQQMLWDEEVKRMIWTEIVTEKIRNQMNVLSKFGYREQADMLKSYIFEIRPGDETNREGHAAKVYFNALFGMNFSRSADNDINAALNYGYSLILSVFNREVVSNGFLTQLGMFHDNMFNPFNLSSDLMEPFRTVIDEKVVRMSVEPFGHEEKMSIVDLLNKDVYIDGKQNTLNNAIKIYCKSVFASLSERDVAEIKFYKYEL
jgi:CRISPR-associated endonuclease cas1, NMENI subtype